MTGPRPMEPFESAFASRAVALTDAAAARHIDALDVARIAIAAREASPWRLPWGVNVPANRRAGVAAVAAVAGIATLAVIVRWVPEDRVVGQPSGPVSTPGASLAAAPLAAELQHLWQRPYAVTPGTDTWGSGFASFSAGEVGFGIENADESRSTAAASGPSTIVVTATAATQGCEIGEIGTYDWTLTGSGTVVTLSPTVPDTCAARQRLLAGGWVRADMTGPPALPPPLPAGTHSSESFDPIGVPAAGEVSYTVPEGWSLIGDDRATLVLQRPLANGDVALIAMFAAPRVLEEPTASTCGSIPAAADVDGSADAIYRAVTTRRGVQAGPPTHVTVGGRASTSVDLQLASGWVGPCPPPDGTPGGIPLLQAGGVDAGAVFGIGPGRPGRLILVSLDPGRTMAIAIVAVGPSGSSPQDEVTALAMPIIESIEFHQPKSGSSITP